MLTLLQPVRDYLLESGRNGIQAWNRFWFTAVDPTTLAVIRIFTGSILLYAHFSCLPELMNFIGPEGWVDATAIQELRHHSDTIEDPELRRYNRWYAQSIWFYIQDPTAIWVLHSCFLAALVCYTVGLGSRVANVIVWVFHVSYSQRGVTLWFGMDAVLVMLLFYQMWGPTGATLSLDRWIRRQWIARQALRAGQPVHTALALRPSWAANISIRLIQIHMCVIYACSGLAKLQGNMWWNGWATWMTISMPEFELISMRWLAYLPDWFIEAFTWIATYGTLFLEIGFPFLIWSRTWRPVILFGVVMLHAGIGVFMGLGAFGAAMLTGCTSFVPPSSFRWLIDYFTGSLRGLGHRPEAQAAQQLRTARAGNPGTVRS
jgi:hypothetical protein